jgi:hypothetical protein
MDPISSLGLYKLKPITVAEWSETLTVFARSDAVIVGSNPTWGWMFGECLRFSVFVLSCV